MSYKDYILNYLHNIHVCKIKYDNNCQRVNSIQNFYYKKLALATS